MGYFLNLIIVYFYIIFSKSGEILKSDFPGTVKIAQKTMYIGILGSILCTPSKRLSNATAFDSIRIYYCTGKTRIN